MKYIKLFEAYSHNYDEMSTVELIEYGERRGWFSRGSCSINSDNTIDVNGDVHIYETSLEELPFNFNIINGDFNLKENPDLTTLKGCPIVVNGNFNCNRNVKITNLKYIPHTVSGELNMEECSITNILGLDNIKCQHFVFNNNKITTLLGCPKRAVRLIFSNNKIDSLDGISLLTSVFSVANNPLKSFKGSDIIIKDMEGYSNRVILYDLALENTIDIPLSDNYVLVNINSLPRKLSSALKEGISFKKILELQDEYSIWHSDGTLNEKRFDILLSDLEDSCVCGGKGKVKCPQCDDNPEDFCRYCGDTHIINCTKCSDENCIIDYQRWS